jgi:NAD-dependent oxidoreductase involved in siderophore biosynthesis
MMNVTRVSSRSIARAVLSRGIHVLARYPSDLEVCTQVEPALAVGTMWCPWLVVAYPATHG